MYVTGCVASRARFARSLSVCLVFSICFFVMLFVVCLFVCYFFFVRFLFPWLPFPLPFCFSPSSSFLVRFFASPSRPSSFLALCSFLSSLFLSHSFSHFLTLPETSGHLLTPPTRIPFMFTVWKKSMTSIFAMVASKSASLYSCSSALPCKARQKGRQPNGGGDHRRGGRPSSWTPGQTDSHSH